MKQGRVRTRTMGLAWEERFLAAVRKGRAQGQFTPDAAEKLRRLAGAYYCTKCKQEHRTESALGRKHLRLQPSPAASPEPTPRDAPPLPVAMTRAAKRAGKRARAVAGPRKRR